MEYNNSYNVYQIQKYIKYFCSLNKKIIILRQKKDIEYIDNIVKCEHYLNIIYPKIKNLIKKINISRDREDIKKLYDLGELYNFNDKFNNKLLI